MPHDWTVVIFGSVKSNFGRPAESIMVYDSIRKVEKDEEEEIVFIHI